MRHPTHLFLLVAVALAGCPGPSSFIECVDQTSCGLAVGGECLVNPATGHKFCAYPDGSCAGGLRWSDYDVEESISGTCVADDRDAGVDATDAPTDAPINDGTLPCGIRVAFHDGPDNAREVWVANAEGTGLINVSNDAGDDANPTWSPDGTRLAFQSKRSGGRWDLFTVNWDGSGLTNITNTPTVDEVNPVWSPDGQRIAFLGAGLKVMYPNGTGIAPVSALSVADSFAWSTDSTKLVFGHVNPSIPDLFVATVGAAGQPVNVTNSTSPDRGQAWAPGPRIVYTTSDLWTVNDNGTGATNLTPGTSQLEYAPRWAPDGLSIVFTSNAQTEYEIHRIAATGGTATRLLDNTLGTASGAGDWVTDVADDGRILFERRTSFTASVVGVVDMNGNGAVFFNGTSGTNARAATFAHCP